MRKSAIRLALTPALVALLAAVALGQAAQQKPFEPFSGQPGKDVVWVPTPQETVNKMLDMAKVTPSDFLMDLGSGDGRTVITAAKRGLRAQGIEYNPDMVELSKRNATAAGVADKATFVKADIFETDFSKAQVLTLFLLPSLNERLMPQILKMRPGTRIVSNTFLMGDWQPDRTETVENCTQWCTVHLWIVPANIEGSWQMPQGTLTLDQTYQNVSGTLGSQVITDGKINGPEVTFKVGNATYSGRADGNTMKGTVTGGSGGSWSATKK